MVQKKKDFQYSEDGISFSSVSAARKKEIYMPLCSTEASGIKSAITPFLSGDIKIDKSQYLTKPVSREDLRNPLRNFFVRTSEGDVFSLFAREGEDSAEVQIGQLWHKLINRSLHLGVELEALNFVPVSGENVELMRVIVRNTSDKPVKISPIGCIPVFGRVLVNKHDHEHVTALLHRTQQLEQGILVSPTMTFNEEGHKECQVKYFVFGAETDGALPKGSFPTVDSFLGDSGTFEWPEAVLSDSGTMDIQAGELDGKEVAGALCFQEAEIGAGGEKEYILMIGTAESQAEAAQIYEKFNKKEKFEEALKACKDFWAEKSGSIVMKTGDAAFDSWMRWVMIQPVLRRIFGCSFLPDHDYGKGGKGWRDLWQDLLSLILIEPKTVRESLIDNFGGVRIDGTNATIIGTGKGEFIADRNAITRVWMDHGAWPVLTMLLYIDQTGDTDILFEKNTYFQDMQLSRTLKRGRDLNPERGGKLRAKDNHVYEGSLLEHMLVQTLTQFFNVGEHNMIRLESADWNDGLDMAFHRGESVAFSSFYAGNLFLLADLVEHLKDERGVAQIEVFKELMILLDSISGAECDYDDIDAKKRLLFEKYCSAVETEGFNEKAMINCDLLIQDLRGKAEWIFQKIRSQEKVEINHEGKTYQWFNGYYDNKGRRVEGEKEGKVRMTLAGQVFPVMNGLAREEDIRVIVESVDAFLKDPNHGGHRLNTDFGVRNYLDLGRAFSFAYGTKENGSVFSHMTVMYAYALYKRGFVREGFKVLDALYRMAINFEQSKIYPNIPEYFDSTGRGMYGYLTGSASWMILTLLTQVFGVRGMKGDLAVDPKLVREQFSDEGKAEVRSAFSGKELEVVFLNFFKLDYGEYSIGAVKINGDDAEIERMANGAVCLKRSLIEKSQEPVGLVVELIRKTN